MKNKKLVLLNGLNISGWKRHARSDAPCPGRQSWLALGIFPCHALGSQSRTIHPAFMKIKILSAWLLSTLVACAAPNSGTNDAKIKVLVITGGHGFKAEPFFKMFQDNPEVTYTTTAQTKAAEAYDRDDLLSYNVVVLYDAPLHITDAQKTNFLALFDKGIGVIVLHHAYLAYPMWDEFERIAGGKYVYQQEEITNGVTYSQYKGNVDIPITIVDPQNPVTAGLHDFVLHDELYSNMHMRGTVTPLLKTGDELLAWTREEKQSRVVGIIVGHGCYADPNFQKLIAQSIHWVAKR
jgi:type 1 glutamine amidotransferase